MKGLLKSNIDITSGTGSGSNYMVKPIKKKLSKNSLFTLRKMQVIEQQENSDHHGDQYSRSLMHSELKATVLSQPKVSEKQ